LQRLYSTYIAPQFKEHGVLVNAVHPGYINSQLFESAKSKAGLGWLCKHASHRVVSTLTIK
jgi:NAD(P)-dependent dehydrogenase (short-subunit alcohol dehydrogenase family)